MTTRQKELGFSLIEMMAVLLIISLMTGVVLLSAPRGQAPGKSRGQDMHRALIQASEDSIVKGQPQAFGLSEEAYYFYEFTDGEWAVKTETEWPEDLTVSFYKDDIEIDIPEEAVPLVIFEPIGLSTPFSLWLEDGDFTMIFSSTGDGRISLEEDQ